MEKKHKKRMKLCVSFPAERTLREWGILAGRRKAIRNYMLLSIAKRLPDIPFKNAIYRRMGVKMGKSVSVMGTNFDIFFPEMIEIGDGSVFGQFTTVLTHEITNTRFSKAPVRIGRNVTLGMMSIVLPGVEIGDNAMVAAYSLVNRDVAPGEFVGGVPIKTLRRGL